MRVAVVVLILLALVLGAMGGGWVKAYGGGSPVAWVKAYPGPTSY